MDSINFARPLQNGTFHPISASNSNSNPQNNQYIPACSVGLEDRTGVVEFFTLLSLEQNGNFSKISSCKQGRHYF
jgi:hypothetical protein